MGLYGVYFKIIRKLSVNIASNFIAFNIKEYSLAAQEKIKALQDFSNASAETEWNSFLDLLSFSFFTVTKILTNKYKADKNIKEILELSFNRLTSYVVQYRNPEIKADKLYNYLDQVFAQNCEDFNKYNLDIKDKRNVVTRITNKIAKTYNKKATEDLKVIIAILYSKVMGLLL